MKQVYLKEDQISEPTIDITIPLQIKRRGGSAMIIVPTSFKKDGSNSNSSDPINDFSDDAVMEKNFDEHLIKNIARAYKWKVMIEEGQVSSLAEVAEKENVTSSYVSRIFDLNFLSPRIVDQILNGTQPRTLKFQDIIRQEIPYSWQEQEERWGIGKINDL